MSAETGADKRTAPALLGWPFSALPLSARLSLAALLAGVLLLAGYFGAHGYPHTAPPQGSELEKRIAAVDRDPTVGSWDDTLSGDLLVERFYILDTTTGDRYVADFLKGRITGVEVVQREDQDPADVLLLDTKDMRRDRAFYSAYITSVSHPDREVDAFYLGVITPTGDRDAFPLNYNGQVPNTHEPFQVGEETDVYQYMLRQSYKDITTPRPIGVFGFNYVLSSSDVFSLFKNEYKLDKAMFVSELLIVDATSKANRYTYFRLLDKYPRSTGN